MEEEPLAERLRLADDRNTAAEALLDRGKLRQALDVLNEAIRLVPGHARTLLNRAEAFERLGMLPQAEADRRRARELGGVAPVAPRARTIEPRPAAAPARSAPAPSRREPPLVTVVPPSPADARGGLPPWLRIPEIDWRRMNLWPLLAIAGVIAVVVAAAVGLLSLTSSGTDTGDSEGPPAVAGATATPGSGSTPTPTVGAAETAGNPFTFVDVSSAWKGRSIEVDSHGAVAVGGSPDAVVAAQLSKGGETMDVLVLAYGSIDAVGGDWELVTGEVPKPKASLTLPAYASAWWNRNLVVVAISRTGGIADDAFEAFIDLGG